jgi:hypothetical protein
VPILFDEPWLQAAQFVCLVGYLFKSSGAVTVTGTTGVEQHPALSAFRGESGVGTTLPMNAQPEKTFLFITTKFFYENFLNIRRIRSAAPLGIHCQRIPHRSENTGRQASGHRKFGFFMLLL